MIQLIAYAGEKECNQLQKLDFYLSNYEGWKQCELYSTQWLDRWERIVDETELVDVLICDVTRKGSIPSLVEARKKHSESLVVPIADATIMPSEYVRPEILPFALLWKPMDDRILQTEIRNLVGKIIESAGTNTEYSFELVTKQDTRYIPYRDILYFEARDKKIYLRLKSQEICFYTTLSKLEMSLPEGFTRCHKSFIINTQHISQIDWTNQFIMLTGNVGVPLSRSYRKAFKEDMSVE